MAKVLIVEDNEDYRNIYKTALAEEFEVDEASDGEDGLKKASAGNYELILLDIIMPKLDGVGFLNKRKEDPKLKNVPVVIMSNLGQEEIFKKCFELGVKYYIIKAEFTPDKVLAVVKKALQV